MSACPRCGGFLTYEHDPYSGDSTQPCCLLCGYAGETRAPAVDERIGGMKEGTHHPKPYENFEKLPGHQTLIDRLVKDGLNRYNAYNTVRDASRSLLALQTQGRAFNVKRCPACHNGRRGVIHNRLCDGSEETGDEIVKLLVGEEGSTNGRTDYPGV